MHPIQPPDEQVLADEGGSAGGEKLRTANTPAWRKSIKTRAVRGEVADHIAGKAAMSVSG